MISGTESGAKERRKRKKGPFIRISNNLFRSRFHGTYYALCKKHGKQFRESLKTTDRALAKRLLAEFLERHDRLQPGSGRLTFGELVESYKKTVLAAKDLKPGARKYANYCIAALLREWKGLEVAQAREITLSDCERWFARRKTSVGGQLINNELGTLKQILDFGVREGVLLQNPAKSLKRVKVQKAEMTIPTREQFSALVHRLRRMGNQDAIEFVELLAYTGMRRSEAAALKWSDVDFKRSSFQVTGGENGTKNRRIRHVPLFPSAKKLLQGIQKTRDAMQPDQNVVRIKECRGGIAAACKAAKLPHFSHHSLRHFFTSNAIEQGVDFKVIADWLGHLDGGLLVAKTYGHLRQQHSELMAQKMTFSVRAHGPAS